MTCQSLDFIATYINLGNAHLSLNNFTEAVDYLHRALHIAKIVLPKYHGNLASIYNNLADVCAEQGKNNEVLEYAKLSLEIKQNCMLSDHPSIAIAYNTLGCIYETLYVYNESVRNYEASLIIFQKHHSDKFVTLAAIN
jgi:tetratricopeptide (TPR) repeat protein